MQVATRRLIIVSIIALFGASAGITLGNFVAGGPKLSGAEELINYSSPLVVDGKEAQLGGPDPGFAERAGPRHYDCTGCDASLYNEVVAVGDDSAALTQPLPPYQTEDAAVPSARPDAPGSTPRRGTPPGSAAPVALLASPVLPGVTPVSTVPQIAEVQ